MCRNEETPCLLTLLQADCKRIFTMYVSVVFVTFKPLLCFTVVCDLSQLSYEGFRNGKVLPHDKLSQP